jgi:hypothetical protein
LTGSLRGDQLQEPAGNAARRAFATAAPPASRSEVGWDDLRQAVLRVAADCSASAACDVCSKTSKTDSKTPKGIIAITKKMPFDAVIPGFFSFLMLLPEGCITVHKMAFAVVIDNQWGIGPIQQGFRVSSGTGEVRRIRRPSAARRQAHQVRGFHQTNLHTGAACLGRLSSASPATVIETR